MNPKIYGLRGSNPRSFETVLKTVALNHSAKPVIINQFCYIKHCVQTSARLYTTTRWRVVMFHTVSCKPSKPRGCAVFLKRIWKLCHTARRFQTPRRCRTFLIATAAWRCLVWQCTCQPKPLQSCLRKPHQRSQSTSSLRTQLRLCTLLQMTSPFKLARWRTPRDLRAL